MGRGVKEAVVRVTRRRWVMWDRLNQEWASVWFSVGFLGPGCFAVTVLLEGTVSICTSAETSSNGRDSCRTFLRSEGVTETWRPRGGLGALPWHWVTSQLGWRAEGCRKPPQGPTCKGAGVHRPKQRLRRQGVRHAEAMWAGGESGVPPRARLRTVARLGVPGHGGGPTCSSPLPPSLKGSTRQGALPTK